MTSLLKQAERIRLRLSCGSLQLFKHFPSVGNVVRNFRSEHGQLLLKRTVSHRFLIFLHVFNRKGVILLSEGKILGIFPGNAGKIIPEPLYHQIAEGKLQSVIGSASAVIKAHVLTGEAFVKIRHGNFKKLEMNLLLQIHGRNLHILGPDGCRTEKKAYGNQKRQYNSVHLTCL